MIETLKTLDNLILVLGEDSSELVDSKDHLTEIDLFASELGCMLKHLSGAGSEKDESRVYQY